MNNLYSVVMLLSLVRGSDWDEQVAAYLAACEMSADRPQPTMYPKLAGRVKYLFQGRPCTHIRIVTDSNGLSRLHQDIYFRPGELHVVQHIEGWNLVSKGGKLYEWVVGQQEGTVIKANETDMVDYLFYLTDPSFIMTSLYYHTIYDPTLFEARKDLPDGSREYRLKDPSSGFLAIIVDEDPLWFRGFEAGSRVIGKPSTIIRFSKPMPIDGVPEEVLKRTEGIKFIESEETLRRHMIFL